MYKSLVYIYTYFTLYIVCTFNAL